MGKPIIAKVLLLVNVHQNMISCQYQQQKFSSPTQFQSQKFHHYPVSENQHHHDYLHPSQSSHSSLSLEQPPNKFDFNKFSHQEKELQAQLHYLDQQLRKNSEQFQFESSVNEDNPSIVETREQSTRDVDKENIPVKTDNKILKYAAVGQSDPVSFIKVIKQHVPVEISHPGHPGLHHHSHHQHRQQQKQLNLSTNETSKTLRTLNYLNRLSSRSQADFYQQQEISAPVPSEYDTEPFYINTPENETIKIIPVPYYIDQNGNKREVFTSTSSEHHTDDDELFPSH